jgi:hypothetical protein
MVPARKRRAVADRDLLLAHIESAEQLLIDADAMTLGAPFRGLPACVVYAHRLHCSPRSASAKELLDGSVRQLDGERLSGARGLAALLLAAADREIQRRSTEAGSDTSKRLPCPEGFHWIGQRWDSCDGCGLPATEHAGMAMPAGGSPFGGCRWRLDPWRPGEVGYVPDPRERLRVVRVAKEAAFDMGDYAAMQALRDLEKTVMAEVASG